MENLLKEMTRELQEWIENEINTAKDAVSKCDDPATVAMKRRWLAVVEDISNGPNGETIRDIIKTIEAEAPYFREAIGKALYEGRLSDDELQKMLIEKSAIDMVAESKCIGCVGCTACATCSSCAVCIVSGVVIASTAITTTSSATSATAAM